MQKKLSDHFRAFTENRAVLRCVGACVCGGGELDALVTIFESP